MESAIVEYCIICTEAICSSDDESDAVWMMEDQLGPMCRECSEELKVTILEDSSLREQMKAASNEINRLNSKYRILISACKQLLPTMMRQWTTQDAAVATIRYAVEEADNVGKAVLR